MPDNLTAPPVDELLRLRDRTVLVTGASGGIGAGVAVRLAEAGATVIAHANAHPERLQPVLAACRKYGVAAHGVQGDLSDPDVVEAIVDEAGTLHGVVNNAALQPLSPLTSMDVTEFDRVFEVNVRAVFLVTQAVSNRAIAEGTPLSIVNIASIEGEVPAPAHSHYAASKAAVIMHTRAAALEFGPSGIRVNVVCPGLINRPGLDEDWPDGVERWHRAAPLGRLGTPADIADACLFLLSDAARWITGATLRVDGGVTANHPF
ncbi:SDR family oxidoreductase [Kibdelosporangium philippinense]|uniref:SDR family oxidoreductase n=1 Tax=Kibdelosporangium philippinense TaxID=211113 RepID=A0ABS8ZV31_9PSEU|nr:SDR family NAD(P)-dependent oxidoreductase [Kibdelosporangium philippinense]MCE7010278.1 SDR family oxidoreductase [Kibdelosporangium philippinense]